MAAEPVAKEHSDGSTTNTISNGLAPKVFDSIDEMTRSSRETESTETTSTGASTDNGDTHNLIDNGSAGVEQKKPGEQSPGVDQ